MAKVKDLNTAKDVLGKARAVLKARGEKGLVGKVDTSLKLIDRTLARVPGLAKQPPKK